MAKSLANVNLKLLQAFLLVGEHSSFRTAAEVSHRSTSAVSAQIRRLEGQLGLGKGELMLWFGAALAVNLQTAFLSPPVAMSAYFLKRVVPRWDLKTIYAGMGQFMAIQVVFLLLLLFFPSIALWLPRLLY